MNLQMETHLADNYRSNSQKIRVITENWVGKNVYCPCCGNKKLEQFQNNRPVADFYCPQCHEEFELKSKSGSIGYLISDGAYDTMLSRINMYNNPNFFFLHYEKEDFKVHDLIMVPKYFFVPEVIAKRKPLKPTAKRAGWVGCNIQIGKIPEDGRICLIKNNNLIPVEMVLSQVQKIRFIGDYKLDARSWTFDVLCCIQKIPHRTFQLSEVYQFEDELGKKYPNNHHIRDKIRQQLQILRDKGILEFQGRGCYKKV